MFSEHLKQVRNKLNLSIAKMANELDMSASTLTSYERGDRLPSIEFAQRLYRVYNVNSNWFVSGDGEMFIERCENTHAFIYNKRPLNNIKNWGQRLAQLLADAKETTLNFAKRTAIGESRLEKFILNSELPTMEELTKIKCNVDISIDELLYAETVSNNTQAENVSLSTDEIRVLKRIVSKF